MKHFFAKLNGGLKAKLNNIRKSSKELVSSLYLRETFVLFFLLLVIITTSLTLIINYLSIYVKDLPTAGGVYTEGIIGQPQTLNPLYSQSSVVDRSISSLIYSGLVKLDYKGDIISDIADRWDISPDGLNYTFYLKKNVLWQDKEKLSAQDVYFTFLTIQDPDYQGPLKNQFKDIKFNLIDDHSISFTLPRADKEFLKKMTLGIIPQHKWAKYAVSDIPYAEENLHPVGSGMFSFKDVTTDSSNKMLSMILERNSNYYGTKPYLESVIFKFYQNTSDIKEAFTKKDIDGSANIDSSSYKELDKISRLRFYSYSIPEYKAIFFNQDNNPLFSSKDLRKALILSVNKKDLALKASANRAEAILGPFSLLPPAYDYKKELDESKNIMKSLGALDSNNDGFSEINGKKLSFKLTILDDNDSKNLAKLIKEDFKQIGVDLLIDEKNSSEFERDVLSPRNYEMVLVGQNYGSSKNLFPFWSSSQLKPPGLNFSTIPSKRIDALLDNYISDTTGGKRDVINKAIEDSLIQDSDAIFVERPQYIFVTDKRIKGLEKNYFVYPEDKYIGIEKWYINKRFSFSEF